MTKQMPPSSPTKANKADRRRSVVVVMLIAVVALGMTMMQHGNEGRENGLPNSVPPTPMIAASGNDASGADETTTVVPLPIAWSGTSAPKVALPVATVTPIGIPTQVASSVPVMTPTIIPTCRVVREYALAGLSTLASVARRVVAHRVLSAGRRPRMGSAAWRRSVPSSGTLSRRACLGIRPRM